MTTEDFQPIKGMSDIRAPEVAIWRMLEEKTRCVMHRYDMREVRTPVLERKDIFVHSLGSGTDVVQKEMYSFERGKTVLALRPEGTAGVIRCLAGIGQDGQDARVYYTGPMFRSEEPQAGRRRQFHQIGVEMISAPNAALDAECIALQVQLFEAWGLTGACLQLNTRGTVEDRKAVTDGLRRKLEPFMKELCQDCIRRSESNVLRVLDCKQASCRAVVKQLPAVTTFMSDASLAYLAEVERYLNIYGMEYTLNPLLVRGLDYYRHTVWEFTHPGLGAQDALAGGGRYGITAAGKIMEGVGFAMGMERVIMALESIGLKAEDLQPALDVWLVALGEAAFEANLTLTRDLRRQGLSCGMQLVSGRSMKAQMRAANRSGARFAIIRGDQELEKGCCVLKNLAAGEQLELPHDRLIDHLTRELRM